MVHSLKGCDLLKVPRTWISDSTYVFLVNVYHYLSWTALGHIDVHIEEHAPANTRIYIYIYAIMFAYIWLVSHATSRTISFLPVPTPTFSPLPNTPTNILRACRRPLT